MMTALDRILGFTSCRDTLKLLKKRGLHESFRAGISFYESKLSVQCLACNSCNRIS